MKRRDLLKLPATALVLESCLPDRSSIYPQTSLSGQDDAEGGLGASNYGAIGDGNTDDTEALQRFLDAVSQTGRVGSIAPGVYRITSRLFVGSNTRLAMHGATLLCFDPALGSGGYNNDVPMLDITNGHDVLIEGGTLDGRKGSFAETEFKAGIGMYGSRNVTLRDVTAVDCKGDGFHISLYDAAIASPYGCQNVVMERCIADRNHRQGLSIISLESGRFTDCTFANTSGTNPQSGVDIEPNSPGEFVSNVHFERCHFDNNSGSGLIVSTVAGGELVQHSISAHDCTMNNNGVWGVWISNGRNLCFHKCTLEGNGDTGLNVLLGTNHRLTVNECVIRGNGVHGLLLLGYGQGGTIDSMDILSCQIGSNGESAPGSFSGIAVGHAYIPSLLHDLTISDCAIGDLQGSNQLFGVMFGEAVEVTGGEMNGNDLSRENIYSVYLPPSVTMEFNDNIGYEDNI